MGGGDAYGQGRVYRDKTNVAEDVQSSASANEAISVGNLVAYRSGGGSGLLHKAQASQDSSLYVAKSGGSSGSSITIVKTGWEKVMMDSVPAASDNGKPVWLHPTSSGVASLNNPVLDTHTDVYVVFIGHLEGADGNTITPEVALDFDCRAQF